MKRWLSFGLIIFIVFSSVLSSCNNDKVTTFDMSHPSTTLTTPTPMPAGDAITEWKSKMLADNMVFRQGIAAIINGKNYLIFTINFGNNPEGSGINADAGIIILDISNPGDPVEIAYLKNGQDEYVQFEGNLKLNGSVLYALTYNYLWIIDVSDPYHPKDMGKTPLTGAFSIEASGKYAYIISSAEAGGQILSTLDISDLIHPHNVGQIVMQPYLITLKSSGYLLFALAANGLYIFDTSTPGALKQMGFLANPFPPLTGVIAPEHIPREFFDMALAGQNLYIVSGIDKLLVVDITNPRAAKIINDLETRYQGNEIIISAGMAYLLSSDGPVQFSQHFANLLESIDISNPGKPNESNSVQLEATYAHSYSSLIAVSNHLYFYDDRYPIIQILDLGSLTDTLK